MHRLAAITASIHVIHAHKNTRACITLCQHMRCSCAHTYAHTCRAYALFMHSHAYIHVSPCRSSSVSITSVHAYDYIRTYMHLCTHVHTYIHHRAAMTVSIRLVRAHKRRKQKQQANSLFMHTHIPLHALAQKNESEHTLC